MEAFRISKWSTGEEGEKLCRDFLEDMKEPKRKKKTFKKTKSSSENLQMNDKLIPKFAKDKSASKNRNKQKNIQKSNKKELYANKSKKQNGVPNVKPNNIKTQKQINTANSEKVLELKKMEMEDGNLKICPKVLDQRQKQLKELEEMVIKNKKSNVKNKPVLTLREKMLSKLNSARFRFLNEKIYKVSGKEAEVLFRKDPEAFKIYHQGYRQQVNMWPMNPLDNVIKCIKKMPKSYIVADFGCGDAKLEQSIEQTVHSFDLVAINDFVIPCNMAHTPLEDSSVDVAVFCLSLMGTNLEEYLIEANRVLKVEGLLKIAEVESRIVDLNQFINSCKQLGFKKCRVDISHSVFYFMDFKKQSNVKDKKTLPQIIMNPCIYKKR